MIRKTIYVVLSFTSSWEAFASPLRKRRPLLPMQWTEPRSSKIERIDLPNRRPKEQGDPSSDRERRNQEKIEASRYWKNYRAKEGLDSKMLLVTDFPPDSRGISFLIWDYSQENKTDDLWLYLPALRMVRRISAQDQNDAFLGSDLTFGDMGQRRLDEDEHKLLREEGYLGTQTYVVESVPKEKTSIYSKKVSWISKDSWTVLKIDYYDRNSKLLKRQTIEWQSLDNFSVWKKTEVTNVQNGHRTIFEVSDLQVNGDLRMKILQNAR